MLPSPYLIPSIKAGAWAWSETSPADIEQLHQLLFTLHREASQDVELDMPQLKFQPLSSKPSPAFWSALNTLKLDKLKLDDGQQPISAWYEEGQEVVDKERGNEVVGVNGSVGVDGGAFGEGSDK